MNKKFKIYENRGYGWCCEVDFSYPIFKSLQEGLRWVHRVLDPYYTGRYGIVNNA